MNHFLFKDRDGQTLLPKQLYLGLKIKTIQNMSELDEHEEANIAKGLLWLEKQKSDPRKYNFWMQLHKKMFGEVWSWAGTIRSHELDNPDFCHPTQIWSELYRLEKDLDTWTTYQSFPIQHTAAIFHERIETIHPFANGNGRFGRVLTEKICKYINGEPPTWGKKHSHEPGKRRKYYINAIVEASRRLNYNNLAEFMFS